MLSPYNFPRNCSSLAKKASPVFSGVVTLPLGTAALPGVAFTNDSDTGLTQGGGANTLSLAAGGAEICRATTAGFQVFGITTTVDLTVSDIVTVTPTSEWGVRLQASSATATARNNFTTLRSAGTAAAPQPAVSGMNLGGLTCSGYDGSSWRYGWNGGFELLTYAAEAWTSSAHGTKMAMRTTPIGASLSAEVFSLDHNGRFSVGGTYGAETLRAVPMTNQVNRIEVTGSTTGSAPSVAAAGADTNIDLAVTTKGTGVVALSYAAQTATTPASFAAGVRVPVRMNGTLVYLAGSISPW